jgi:hypothetical protein
MEMSVIWGRRANRALREEQPDVRCAAKSAAPAAQCGWGFVGYPLLAENFSASRRYASRALLKYSSVARTSAVVL